MSYKRKTKDEYRLLANYGQGFEHEISEDTYADLKQRLKEYRENAPQYAYTWKKVRLKIELPCEA